MSVWRLDYSSFQQLFANEYSLKILALIFQRKNKICAADISKLLDIHISTAKKYLDLLAKNNILKSEQYLHKPGKPTFYSLLVDRIDISLDLSQISETMDVPPVAENIPNPLIREDINSPPRVQFHFDNKDMVTEISVKVRTKAKKTIAHKIILNETESQFMKYIPHPTMEPESFFDICTKAGISDYYSIKEAYLFAEKLMKYDIIHFSHSSH
ncbi:MAG: hypothetical protein JSW11_15110 [Candidatus Heimdallarchaeota archaeon]|nr:MAG: hypothetical protein JSW11_15110 [Candidatus Heimdallarchaeota archaeon]